MHFLRHIAAVTIVTLSGLIFASDSAIKKKKRHGGDIEVFVNERAQLEKPSLFAGSQFEVLPHEMVVKVADEVLVGDDFWGRKSGRVGENKDALNCRLVQKDWSNLFIFKIQSLELDLRMQTSFDPLKQSTSFSNDDTQKMLDMIQQKKIVMGHYRVLHEKYSEEGLRLLCNEMVKSENPHFQGNAKLLNQVISENNYVKELRLYAASAESQEAVGELVKKCKNLSILNMRDADIGDVGAKAVASALSNHQKLQKIDCYRNNVTDSGAIAFAQAIKTNKSLKVLDLHNGKIGWEGAQAIALALPKNDTIDTVYLSGQDLEPWNWVGHDFPSVNNVRKKIQEKGNRKRISMS